MSVMTRITFIFHVLFVLCACNKADATGSEVRSADMMEDTVHIVSDTITDTAVPLTFAFAGDIMMGTTYPETPSGAYLPPDDGANLFTDVAGILTAADIAAANLEGTLLDGAGKVKKCGDPTLCYAFRMPTRYVKHLTDAGLDFMSVANNHINDFGPEGVTSTLQVLANAGIASAGLRNSCPTAIIEKNGRKIGFAAFGHNRGTLSILNLDEVRHTVGVLAKECDIVIVSFHGGAEGAKYTHVTHSMEMCFGERRGDVEAFAHAAIDAGADIVYGHGPHVTRALELYNDRLIIYSLGNFCTPYRINLKGISGHAPVVAVTVNPDGSFSSGRIHSFIQIPGKGPRLDLSNSVAKHMKALSQSDFPLSPLTILNDGRLIME